MNTIREVTKMFGTQAKMAAAVNATNPDLPKPCTQDVVGGWVRNGQVPVKWLHAVELAAKAQGLRGITATVLAQIAAKHVQVSRETVKGAPFN